MNAGIILTVPFLQNPAITAVLLPTHAVNVLLVTQLRHLPVDLQIVDRMTTNFGAVTVVVITADVWQKLVMIVIIIQDIQDVLILAGEQYF